MKELQQLTRKSIFNMMKNQFLDDEKSSLRIDQEEKKMRKNKIRRRIR